MTHRLLAAVGFALAGGVLAAFLGATAFVMGPLPSRRGRVVVSRLQAPVTARFDRQGVPHLRAVLETDAWRALGFIHASDRLFQMEVRRRAAYGRLAEVFGKSVLRIDREARINGYASLAQRDWDELGPKERAVLEAYADGVNAFLAEQTLPLEFRALSLSPEPWTPIDSLAFERLLQADLSIAAGTERGAFDDALARGLPAAIALYDASVPGSTEVAKETADVLAGEPQKAGEPGDLVEPVPPGSNAWAIDGRHTASGKPLLAGDPHLRPERPGVWYAAHVTTADGLDVVGLTFPGFPGIAIGHNGLLAWSLTMHQADDSDLYLERVDWAKGTYMRGDRWVPLAHASEAIRVKGAPDDVVDVWRTVHGPIVLRLDDRPGFALARAFAPDFLPQGPRAFLEASRAKNGAELALAWSHFSGPSVNICWAEASGRVGVMVAGAIPRRPGGDGRFPVPGWITTFDWDGTIPPDKLPAVVNPPDGIVATANDDWSVAGLTLPYPGVFAESDRAGRAHLLGASLHAATVRDMRAMQNDVYSPYAARIVSVLRELRFADARAARAVSVLGAWDARAEVRGPSRLFFCFLKELRKDAGPPGLRVSWSMLEATIAARDAKRIEGALARAIDLVEHEGGTDPSRWSFGHVHRLLYPHPFADALPGYVARRLAFGPVALPGEWHTLNVAGFPLRGDRYDVIDIPSARLIVDLSRPDDSRFVLPLGQSGQLFDRHARDQLDAWSSGRDFELPYTAKAVEAATISMLQLLPGD